jgi:hypothetical protein
MGLLLPSQCECYAAPKAERSGGESRKRITCRAAHNAPLIYGVSKNGVTAVTSASEK